MDGKKKIWATAVLCAVASVGFVVPAGAEETMTHDLDEVIVEADRNTLPGGFVANNDRVGILGNIKPCEMEVIQSVSSLTAPEHIPKGIIPTVENTENIITTSASHNKITA